MLPQDLPDEMTSDIGRFGMMPEWVLDSGISLRALQLYLVLSCKYVDRHTKSCTPSRLRLANDLGCGEYTLDKAMKELVDVGAVRKRYRNGADGSPTSNSYTLIYAAPGGLENKPTSPRKSHTIEENQATTPSNLAHPGLEKSTHPWARKLAPNHNHIEPESIEPEVTSANALVTTPLRVVDAREEPLPPDLQTDCCFSWGDAFTTVGTTGPDCEICHNKPVAEGRLFDVAGPPPKPVNEIGVILGAIKEHLPGVGFNQGEAGKSIKAMLKTWKAEDILECWKQMQASERHKEGFVKLSFVAADIKFWVDHGRKPLRKWNWTPGAKPGAKPLPKGLGSHIVLDTSNYVRD